MAEIPSISHTLVRTQLYFCGVLCVLTILWCTYRELYKRKLQREGAGKFSWALFLSPMFWRGELSQLWSHIPSLVGVGTFFLFFHLLGWWSNLTNIFQGGWNHQPANFTSPFLMLEHHFVCRQDSLCRLGMQSSRWHYSTTGPVWLYHFLARLCNHSLLDSYIGGVVPGWWSFFIFSPTNPSEKSENPWILYDFIHLYPKVVSYILAMWGCWMSYVIFDGLYFPPSAAFWQDVFQSWDGDWMQFFFQHFPSHPIDKYLILSYTDINILVYMYIDILYIIAWSWSFKT